MAGNVGSLDFANGVIKIVGGAITKQYEESKLLYNRLNKGKGKKIGDRGIEIPTHVAPNANHKWLADGGEHAVGGANLVKRAQVFFKNFSGSVRLTGGAMDSINSGDVAYIKDWKDFNLTETMGQMYKMFNIYSHGTGSGRLATISTGAANASQAVSNNDANRFLRQGLVIDTVTPATGVVTGTGTILNPKASATTFTLESTLSTSVTGDFVVASGSFNLAMTGLKAIIDDTTNAPVTFQGLSRDTYPGDRATRVNAGSTLLDVSHLRRALSAGIHVAKGELNRDVLEIWSHMAQLASYSDLGWNLKRFEGKSKSLDLGYTVYGYEGINWVEDPDADKDRIDFIDFDSVQKYTVKDFGWDDKTGSIWNRVMGTNAYKDQFEAYLTQRGNLGCVRPNSNAFIDGLTIPEGY